MMGPSEANASERCFRCGRTRAQHPTPRDGRPAEQRAGACPGFMPSPSIRLARVGGGRDYVPDDPSDEAEYPPDEP